MTRFITFLVTAFCFSAVFADDNVCNTGNVLNRPVNGQPKYWPATWRTNETAPTLSAGQSCSWIVTVPAGYYAKLMISGKMNDNSSFFQTVDTAGNRIKTAHENKEPYYFPSPKFSLFVSNQAAATFAFRVVWAKFPSTLQYSMGVSEDAQLVNITEGVFAADFSSLTGLSLLAFPADPKNYHTLRSTLVFEGKDYNGNYSLLALQDSQSMDLSTCFTRLAINGSGQVIYVVNLEARHRADMLLVQDSAYTKDITKYVEMDCPRNSTCNVSVDGGDKKTAFISVGTKTDVIWGASVFVDAYLTVYYGSQNDQGYQESISGYDLPSNLPLTYSSDIIQYVVSHGKAYLTYHVDP